MTKPGSTGEPDDVDAAFAEIVADLRAEGIGSTEADARTEKHSQERADPAPDHNEAAGWRESNGAWEDTLFGADPAADDEHFVPPEPPPLPRPRKGAAVVLILFILGLLLVIAPQVIGVPVTVATPLGILTLAGGLALLLLRVRQDPPDGADPENGAQV